MSSMFFRRAAALIAGAAVLLGSVLVAAPSATAGPVLPASPYTLSIRASNASPYYLLHPEGLALDAGGNLFIYNGDSCAVIKVAPNNSVTPVAGYGECGDAIAGPALDTALGSWVYSMAVNASGILYLPGLSTLARVDAGGTLALIGSGFNARGVAVDSSGNLYIADTGNNRVKKMTPGGSITTIAGTGTAGTPTAGTATSSALRSPNAVAVDASGNVYIADTGNHMVEKVTSGGTLSVIAGTGTAGSPTSGTATSSALNTPQGVAVDASGNVFIADSGNNMVEKVTSGGTLSIIAGTGTAGAPTAGNGTSSKLYSPVGIVVDSSGVIYVADTGNNDVVKLVSSVSAPAAPTSLSATPGDTTASISFSAGSDGGGSITKYQYTTNDGGSWSDAAAGTTSPISITGLTNGTTYSIKIRAYNSAGGGTASSAVSVTPTAAVSAPSAPTGLGATAGAGSASISFTAGFDGGASITKYQYTTNDGGSWSDAAAGTTSPISITGLTNGTTYSIKIRAYNSAGGGAASASAVSVTPRTTPSAPTGLSVTSGNASATINFTPGSDGGSPILAYYYSLDGGNDWVYENLGTSSPVTIRGLTNGTSTTIRLRAVNAIGAGPSSADVTVTPARIPYAPRIEKVTPGDGSATLTITPGSDGGSAITKYQYRVGDGSWIDAGTTSSITVTGLTNYQTYVVRVRAVNDVGAGPVDTDLVRPRAAAPLLLSAEATGRTRISVTFSSVTIASASINGYDAIAYLKGTDTKVATCHVNWRGRSCDINSLNRNTEYDIRVIAFFQFNNYLTDSQTLESAARTVRTTN